MSNYEYPVPNLAGIFQPPALVPRLPAVTQHRAQCIRLAQSLVGERASIYDLIVMTDYLDRGRDALRDEPAPCSCNNPEAEHPRGDEAFCRATQDCAMADA